MHLPRYKASPTITKQQKYDDDDDHTGLNRLARLVSKAQSLLQDDGSRCEC